MTQPRQKRLDSGNAAVKRVWALAMVALMALLGFWFWHGNRNHGSPAPTDPVAIEQQARDNPDDMQAQMRWGETLVQAKRLEEARSVLDRVRAVKPNDARPYAWLGVVAISERRPDEARQLLGQSLQLDASNLTAIRALANLDAQEHHLRPAIQGFERLVQLRPNDADAWQRLGLLLIGAGENYRSLDALSRSAALDPNDLLTQGALGNMALQAGRFDQAERAYRAVLARTPSNPQAMAGLARVMMRRDPSPAGLTAAEKQAEEALSTSPSAETYSTRGQVRMTQRRWREAIQDFNESISLAPQHRETYVLLSQCYVSEGKPDLARKASAEFERLRNAQLATDRAAAQAAEKHK